MRDIVLTLVVLGLIPRMFRRPDIGLMMFTWISLMNPHKLAWGFARELPFAAMAAATTLAGLLVWKEPKRIPWMATNILLLTFLIWMLVTTIFALNPEVAWEEWDVVWKVYLISFLIMMVINTRERVIRMTWVITLSMAFYGVKGGIFTLRSGGGETVFGPEGTMLGGNNEVALAMIMTIPLLRYLQMNAENRIIRHGMGMAIALTLLCTVGSQSRGALIGLAAMLLFLILKSRNKFPLILSLVLAVPLILAFMPASWHQRMHSIENYETDGSAMGRINAWHTAFNIATDRALGGGLKCLQSHYVYRLYSPNPNNVHDAHSIYFQELGEHGFIGLALFLAIGLTAWMTASKTIKLGRKNPQLKWLADLCAMIQVSFVGFASAGLFLGLANFDLYYDLLALVVACHALAKKSPVGATENPKSAAALPARRQPDGFVRPVILKSENSLARAETRLPLSTPKRLSP